MRTSWFVALLGLAACSSAAGKEVPAPGGDGAGRVHRFRIGALEAMALEDGVVTLPNDGAVFWPGHVEEAGDLLAAAGLARDEIRLSIQPLLVKADRRVLLFDAGARGAIETAGRLQATLAVAGVAPGDVTDIFISHAHSDHVFGLLAKDTPAFPSATIHLSAPEWAAVQAEEAEFAAAIAARVTAFEPGTQVVPDVRAVATAGHTVGHSSYLIGEGDERLFYLGDVAHHQVVSVQRPAWPVEVDGDRSAAVAMREQTLARLAGDGVRVYAVHFPFPGLGRFTDRDGALAWQAE